MDASEEPLGNRFTSKFLDRKNASRSDRTFSSSRNRIAGVDDDIILAGDGTGVLEGGPDVRVAQGRECFADICRTVSGGEHLEHLPYHDAGTLEGGLAVADLRVSDDVLVEADGHVGKHSDMSDGSSSFSRARWTQVKRLKVGARIAVAGDEGTTATWDEIVAIELMEDEQVWDIEVEGTHNFVGNGIVAHNTYITGNLGLGKSSPVTKLEVVGTISGTTLQINGAGTFLTDITVSGGDITGAGGAALDLGESTAGDVTVTGDLIVADDSFLGIGSAAGRIVFDDQGTDEINILSARLGVGTSAPTTALDVVGTISGSALTLNGPANNSYILGNLSIGKTGAGLAKLDVVGTISGTTLQINGAGTFLTDITVSGGDITGAGGAALDLGESTGAGGAALDLGESTAGDVTVTGDLIVADDSFLGLSSSAGRIVFDDQGTDEINILSARLGVGTSAPTTALDVVGTISGSALTLSGPANNSYILGNLSIGKTGAGLSKLDVVGTISGTTLQINGAGTFLTDITVSGGDITGAGGAAIDLGESTAGDVTVTGDLIVADDSFLGLSSSAGRIVFDDQATDEINIMSARLGVGTSAPTTALDVVGTISGSALTLNGPANNSYILGNLSIGKTGAGLAKLDVVGTISGTTLQINGAGTFLTDITVSGGDITGAGGAALDLGESTAGDVTVTGDLIVADDSFLGISSSAGRLVFDDQATDEINILSANLGIGTSAPKAALDVVGTISGTTLQINGAHGGGGGGIGSGGEYGGRCDGDG
ncbi:MAG: Metallophosphoesterase [Candidatus Peregrinibacteria bacterium Greene0416_19]|nr:MAG: Metallophosphoesterase [Candidatus Peregrinibacteria bacterium Greene0416_19]